MPTLQRLHGDHVDVAVHDEGMALGVGGSVGADDVVHVFIRDRGRPETREVLDVVDIDSPVIHGQAAPPQLTGHEVLERMRGAPKRGEFHQGPTYGDVRVYAHVTAGQAWPAARLRR